MGFVGEVGGLGCAVVECLVGSDGVVDDAEAVGFRVESVAVADVAAEQVLLFECFEGPLDEAVGLG